jgi:hypothetical protein
MDRSFDLCAALFAVIAAILWFMSAAGGLPTMVMYWGAAPLNDPFHVALVASARWNACAAASSGASALCMGAAAAIRWNPAVEAKFRSVVTLLSARKD